MGMEGRRESSDGDEGTAGCACGQRADQEQGVLQLGRGRLHRLERLEELRQGRCGVRRRLAHRP